MVGKGGAPGGAWKFIFEGEATGKLPRFPATGFWLVWDLGNPFEEVRDDGPGLAFEVYTACRDA